MKSLFDHKNASNIAISLGTILIVAMMLMVSRVNANSIDSIPQQTAETIELSYQGMLLDPSGNPLNGNYEITFRIYNAPTGSTPLWEEARTGVNAVPVQAGIFNVILGSLNPIPATMMQSNPDLFLGITIGEDAEMLPRVEMIEQYSFGESASAQMPVGSVISWWRPDSTTPLPSGDWMIADGSVVTDPTSPFYNKTLPDLRNKFVMGVNEGEIGQTGGSNSLDLSHQHQVNSHTHSIPDHVHSDGSLYANVSVEDDRVYVRRYGPGFSSTNANYTNASHANSHITDASADIGGSTGSWSGVSGESAPTTSTSLSTTTDNRPEYVGLIYLIRVK